MSNSKRRSFRAAFGGIIAALSVVLMFMTGLLPSLTYAVPAVCGALLMAAVIEINSGFGAVIYVAVSILSLLMVADKEAAVMYAAFFGYYPILKGFIERIKNTVVTWVLKYIVFNAAVVSAYFVLAKVFLIPFEGYGEDFLGKFALPLLLILANIVFALYDIALTRLVTAYLQRWRKYVTRIFK